LTDDLIADSSASLGMTRKAMDAHIQPIMMWNHA